MFVLSNSLVQAQYFKEHSVLAKGTFYKLKVVRDGIYKIDAGFIKSLGIDPEKIAPEHLRVFGAKNGMLPQSNASAPQGNLKELSLYLQKDADQGFGSEDIILFYAQGPHRTYFDDEKLAFRKEMNLYDDSNYYFLSLDQGAGLKMPARKNQKNEGLNAITSYDALYFHESDIYNLLGSGREWLGEQVETGEKRVFDMDLSGIIDPSRVTISTEVLSVTTSPSDFIVSTEAKEIGKIGLSAVKPLLYGRKGISGTGHFAFSAQAVDRNGKLPLIFTFDSSGEGLGYINRFSLHFKRQLKRYGKSTTFQSLASLDHKLSYYQLSEATGKEHVWDITSPMNPIVQEYAHDKKGRLSFSSPSEQLRRYIVFEGVDFPYPESEGKISPQNLHGMESPTFLIISPRAFLKEAKRFAKYRSKASTMSVSVVSVEEVYNEFSSGRQDITALRNFIRSLYLKSKQLRYVLLFGDASYDYKDRLAKNTNWIPTYQSRDYLHNVHSYASDDYYTFMDDNEGEWSEDNRFEDTVHYLDLGIGRFPVQSPEEARKLVDKVIYYETCQHCFGDWKNNVAYVADNGEENKFMLQSDILAEHSEGLMSSINPSRIFVGAHTEESATEAVRKEIQEHINSGVFLMDYIGHGGETAWADEYILEVEDIEAWENKDKLPILLTATCEFGRHDDPLRNSGAEIALLSEKGGAIATFTTARPMFVNTNYDISRAFYSHVFRKNKDGSRLRLGDILKDTKNDSEADNINRNFILLGDPSMRVAYPERNIKVSKITIEQGLTTDRLRPGQQFTFSGEVLDGANVDTQFNGEITATLLDKVEQKKTLPTGETSTVIRYKSRENMLFRGRATVKAGIFAFTAVLPVDINPDVLSGHGKLSTYAVDKARHIDASGSELLSIEGDALLQHGDSKGPDIQAYLNGSDFVNGGRIRPKATLFLELRDEQGINVSERNQRGILAILDGKTEYNLTPYYRNNRDDFRSGQLEFPIGTLEPGQHRLFITAYDTQNNPGKAIVDFTVVNEDEVLLESFSYYPNPAEEYVDFYFTYANLKQNAYISLKVYDTKGTLLHTVSESLIAGDKAQDGYHTLRFRKNDGTSVMDNKLCYFVFELWPSSVPQRKMGKLIFR